MRVNRNMFRICLLFVVSSIAILVAYLSYRSTDTVTLSIITGIFTGFFVSLCTAVVQYMNEYERFKISITSASSKILCKIETCNICLLEMMKDVTNPQLIFQDVLFDRIRQIITDAYMIFFDMKIFEYAPLCPLCSPKKMKEYLLLQKFQENQGKVEEMREIMSFILYESLDIRRLYSQAEGSVETMTKEKEDEINKLRHIIIDKKTTMNAQIGSLHSLLVEAFSLLNEQTMNIHHHYKRNIDWESYRRPIMADAAKLAKLVMKQ